MPKPVNNPDPYWTNISTTLFGIACKKELSR